MPRSFIRSKKIYDLVEKIGIAKTATLEGIKEKTVREYVAHYNQLMNVDVEIRNETQKLGRSRQKLMDTNRIERKAWRERARLDNAIEDMGNAIKKLLKSNKIHTKTKEHDISEAKKVGIFHFTDPHFNELVMIKGNSYDFNIASQRAREFVLRATEIFLNNNIKTVVFADTGDKLNSDRRLDEVMSNATNRAQAQFIALEIMSQMILELNDHFNIVYTYVVGNESRMMEEMTYSHPIVTDNYDYNISEMIGIIFENATGITFVRPDSPLKTVISVGGKNILLVHGTKAGNDPHSYITKLIRQYADKGIVIHYVLLGHIHECLIADMFSRGGSMVGANAYSEDGLNLTSRASQNIHTVSPEEIESIKIDLQNPTCEGYDITKKLEAYSAKSASKNKSSTVIFKVVV